MINMFLKNQQGETFEMPIWQDCGWRRITCGQDKCPMCGRLKRQKEKCIAKGLDPDSWEAVMECVSDNFSEVSMLLKKDAERLGIDLDNIKDIKIPEPPEPETYSVYEKLMELREGVFNLFGEAKEWGETWPELEAGQDLSWYINSLPIKYYRAVSGKWGMENGEEEAWVDYYYTKRVVLEIIKILGNAFVALRREQNSRALQFQILHSQLANLKTEILNSI